MLETLRERFEQQWSGGAARPSIDTFLRSGTTEEGNRILAALVRLELQLRLQAGEPARVEEYLQRYPRLQEHPEGVAELVALEFRLRSEREPGLSLTEYYQRFAQHAAALDKVLADLAEKETLTNPPAPPTSPLIDPDLPAIPGFEVLTKLGEGGMGVVYQARQLDVGGRLVALKMIRTEGAADPERLARFQTEASIVGRLRHPHIVEIYTCGLHHNQPYVVFEYLPGGSLAQRLGDQPWEPRRAATLIAELAGAVDYAHGQGILHRDLKPGNILFDETSQPHLADFGLARMRRGESDLTREGDAMGTPAYMPPEQAAVRREDMSPATDVFALGAILYHLLTGKPIYTARDVREAVQKARAAVIEPPRKVNPRIPTILERICQKALAADPRQRYQRAADLQMDLQSYLDRPRRLWRRLVMGAGAVLLGIMGGIAYQALQHPAPAPEVVEPKKPPLLIHDNHFFVRIGSQDPQWDGQCIGKHAEAFPLRDREKIQVEVHLNQPAYVCVVGRTTDGEFIALYPWALERLVGLGEKDALPDLHAPYLQVTHITHLCWPKRIKLAIPGRPLEAILVVASRASPSSDNTLGDLIDDLRGPPEEPGGADEGIGDAGRIDDRLKKAMQKLQTEFELVRCLRLRRPGP